MNINQSAESGEAHEIDRYPCPFCGKSQKDGPDHDDDYCFFPLSEKLKTATGSDAFHIANMVATAWRKRYLPDGHMIAPDAITDAILEAIKKSHQNGIPLTNPGINRKINYLDIVDLQESVYPEVVKAIKSICG